MGGAPLGPTLSWYTTKHYIYHITTNKIISCIVCSFVCVKAILVLLCSLLVLILSPTATPAPAPSPPSPALLPAPSLDTKMLLHNEDQSEEVLSRKKRFFLGPVSFGRVGLVGARLQIFPHAPLGANNLVAFNLDIEVPRSLAFLIPGQ